MKTIVLRSTICCAGEMETATLARMQNREMEIANACCGLAVVLLGLSRAPLVYRVIEIVT